MTMPVGNSIMQKRKINFGADVIETGGYTASARDLQWGISLTAL
jgi:hypothetical protein